MSTTAKGYSTVSHFIDIIIPSNILPWWTTCCLLTIVREHPVFDKILSTIYFPPNPNNTITCSLWPLTHTLTMPHCSYTALQGDQALNNSTTQSLSSATFIFSFLVTYFLLMTDLPAIMTFSFRLKAHMYSFFQVHPMASSSLILIH